ncbi:MAG TPA: prepilin-type N-terminal cleavage/methylation domain-containing protein [Candidatus Saccharimonadales bacterium]|nr:prepilin-type N-terminal cleavage/methylation domain-containing protein [Candidatus Saccharimonadales bacterium]
MIKNRSSESGFTLIELLIVIVIIGILAGVVLTVIDPAGQQKKARETVLRATVEKACLALAACGQTSTDATNCDTKAEIGVLNVNQTPTGANYFVNGAVTPGDVDAVAASATADVIYRGVLGTCRFECDYNFNTATAGAMKITTANPAGSVCVIGVQ